MGWTKANDAILFELFRKGANRGGISAKDLKPKDIHGVLERFYKGSDRNYENFAALFRRKARAFELAQELSGARKKKSKLSV